MQAVSCNEHGASTCLTQEHKTNSNHATEYRRLIVQVAQGITQKYVHNVSQDILATSLQPHAC